jgi:lysophospholipase L1-like esterase
VSLEVQVTPRFFAARRYAANMRLRRRSTTGGALLAVALFACSGSDDAQNAPLNSSDASSDANVSDAGILDGSAIDSAQPVPVEPIHYLGRFDTSDADGPRFAYPGSAIATTFTGTGIDAKLVDQNQNYFDVVVDDAAPVTIMTSGTQTYTLAKDLPAGTHSLVLTKITESFQGIVQFQGFTPAGGGITPSPFPFSRRIEMIGDSITCGYGVLGAGPTCSFSAATEDEDQAWGALAAKKLNAMNTAIAYSGRGMVRNSDGSTTDLMPEIWLRTFADDPSSTWDTKQYAPDVVVINLGTNDFAKGDPGAEYVTAYNAFIATLRKAYPTAYIVCVVGPMLDGASLTQAQTYVNSVVSTQNGNGDHKVSYLSVPEQLAADGYGCDYHPNQITQGKMAAVLEAHLSALLGW